jgi:hypothetical protein
MRLTNELVDRPRTQPVGEGRLRFFPAEEIIH